MEYSECHACTQRLQNIKCERIFAIKMYLIAKGVKVTEDVKSIGLYDDISMYMNNRCYSGYECQILQRQNDEGKKIAKETEQLIISFLQTASKEDMYELLGVMQGYFPIAVDTARKYWCTYHNEEA